MGRRAICGVRLDRRRELLQRREALPLPEAWTGWRQFLEALPCEEMREESESVGAHAPGQAYPLAVAPPAPPSGRGEIVEAWHYLPGEERPQAKAIIPTADAAPALAPLSSPWVYLPGEAPPEEMARAAPGGWAPVAQSVPDPRGQWSPPPGGRVEAPFWGPPPAPPELNVLEHGAIGERLEMVGTIAGDRSLVRIELPTIQVRVELEPEQDSEDPFQIGRAGKPLRGDKPIRWETREDPRALALFQRWKVEACVGIAGAGELRGPAEAPGPERWTHRAKVVGIDAARRTLRIAPAALMEVARAQVWNDDGPAIQKALDLAAGLRGLQDLMLAVVRIPAGVYPVNLPYAEDNLPLRIGSVTALVGAGVGRTVLRLADEANQRLDKTQPRPKQPDHATLITNSASRLYVAYAIGHPKEVNPPPVLERANERIFLGRLTLDGNKEHQRQQHSGGGLAAVWRQAPAPGDADLAWLSKWVDVKKLVRWGSGERSVEAVAAGPTDPLVSEIADPEKKLPRYWVAVALVSGRTGEQSTALIIPAAVATRGPFDVVIHGLPENEYIDPQNPPLMKVFVRPTDGRLYDEFELSKYRLVSTIRDVRAGVAYRCQADAPGIPERPPGCLDLTGVRRLLPTAGPAWGASGCGVSFDELSDFRIEDVEVREFAVGGIHLGSQGEGRAAVGTLERVDIHGVSWFGVDLIYECAKLSLIDCTIWDCAYGVDVEDITKVDGLRLVRCGILECKGQSFQVVPPIGPGQWVKGLELLGCVFVGNPTHIVFDIGKQTAATPGLVDGVTIGPDPTSGRPCVFAYGRQGVLSVIGQVLNGRLKGAILRRNGSPKWPWGTMGPNAAFIPPRGPYYEASSRLLWGINEPLILFRALPGPGAKGPQGWTIEGNEIEPTRYSLILPKNDHGVIKIEKGLGGYSITGNLLRFTWPKVYLTNFVVVDGKATEVSPPIVVDGNTGGENNFEIYYLAPDPGTGRKFRVPGR